MTDSATALKGIEFDGPLAWVREAPLQGMVTLRGDLSDAAVVEPISQVTGCPLPGQRAIVQAGSSALAWMSPDELLLLVSYAEADATVVALDAALTGQHALAVNVSDARAVFQIGGPGAREVLARLCPVDLSLAAFSTGETRRTRLAQVPAAFWVDEADTFTLVCFRSVARYVFDLLRNAAANGKVGFLVG